MFVWSKLSSAQEAEAWEQRLAKHRGLVITRIPGRKSLRLEVYCDRRASADKLHRQCGGMIRVVRHRNWASLRPELPAPVKIRRALLICAESNPRKIAALQKADPRRSVISIPPDMAFGTGHHATTAAVLRLLADFAASRGKKPWNFCDLGCGSGVLAIAAAKLGASEIWGCDFDPHAVRVAQVNVRRNRARGIVIAPADVLQWNPRVRYACVAANLFCGVLIAAFPRMVRAMKRGGVILISGILKSQSCDCLRAGKRAGLKFDTVITKGKWVTARGMRVD